MADAARVMVGCGGLRGGRVTTRGWSAATEGGYVAGLVTRLLLGEAVDAVGETEAF